MGRRERERDVVDGFQQIIGDLRRIVLAREHLMQ